MSTLEDKKIYIYMKQRERNWKFLFKTKDVLQSNEANHEELKKF